MRDRGVRRPRCWVMLFINKTPRQTCVSVRKKKTRGTLDYDGKTPGDLPHCGQGNPGAGARLALTREREHMST